MFQGWAEAYQVSQYDVSGAMFIAHNGSQMTYDPSLGIFGYSLKGKTPVRKGYEFFGYTEDSPNAKLEFTFHE
jgi:hypothetical protein